MKLPLAILSLVLAMLTGGPVQADLEGFDYFEKPQVEALPVNPAGSDLEKAINKLNIEIATDKIEPMRVATGAVLLADAGRLAPSLVAHLKLNAARKLRRANAFLASVDMYVGAIKEFRNAHGEMGREVFEPLYEYTHFLVQNPGFPTKARSSFEQLASVALEHFPEDSLEKAMVLMLEADLINLEYLNGIEGEGSWFRGMKRRGRLSDARQIFVKNKAYSRGGDTRFLHARIHSNQNRAKRAIEEARDAIKLYQRAGAEEGDVRLLRCHTYLAQLYYRVRREQAAKFHINYVSKYQSVSAGAEPVTLYKVPPSYPYFALVARTSGWTLVKYTIDIDGSVSKAAIVDADPKGVFDGHALKAVRRWRFIPVRRDGELVPFDAEVVLTFVPADGGDPVSFQEKQSARVVD